MNTKINATQLMSLLHNAKIKVTFTKVDGSERVMNCTLLEDYLAPEATSYKSPEEKNNPSIFVVWDLDEEDWRSFRVNSVKSVIVGMMEFSPAKSMLLA